MNSLGLVPPSVVDVGLVGDTEIRNPTGSESCVTLLFLEGV